MTSYGYILVNSSIIAFNLNCIMQWKQFYNIAIKVCSRLQLLVIYLTGKCWCGTRWLIGGSCGVSLRPPVDALQSITLVVLTMSWPLCWSGQNENCFIKLTEHVYIFRNQSQPCCIFHPHPSQYLTNTGAIIGLFQGQWSHLWHLWHLWLMKLMTK